MDTLLQKRDFPPLNLLILPTRCAASTEESHDLVEKREARLRWMREQGVTYLGDPLDKRETRPQWQPGTAQVRLVSFQRHREQRANNESQPQENGARTVRSVGE